MNERVANALVAAYERKTGTRGVVFIGDWPPVGSSAGSVAVSCNKFRPLFVAVAAAVSDSVTAAIRANKKNPTVNEIVEAMQAIVVTQDEFHGVVSIY